jgi:heme exporter protein D
MVNGQSMCATQEKENAESAASPSGKRVKLNDATYTDKSRASDNMAACDEKKRGEKLQVRLGFGKLAEQNREEKAKRDEEQLKARQALGRFQAAEAEQRRKPEVAAQKAPREQRIAESEQREQKVWVAFCFQCTGTFVPLAALVCPDVSSAAAVLQKAEKEAQRQQRIAESEQREQKVWVAFCLPCGTGTVLALAALVCVLVPLCSAALRLRPEQFAAVFRLQPIRPTRRLCGSSGSPRTSRGRRR